MDNLKKTMMIGDHEFLIIGYMTYKGFKNVPFVDIPMMSDFKWQLRNLQDRLERPEIYREILGEDVELVISDLMSWLSEHVPALEVTPA